MGPTRAQRPSSESASSLVLSSLNILRYLLQSYITADINLACTFLQYITECGHGVRQGSILGPFSLLLQSNLNTKSITYADDVTLMASQDNMASLDAILIDAQSLHLSGANIINFCATGKTLKKSPHKNFMIDTHSAHYWVRPLFLSSL